MGRRGPLPKPAERQQGHRQPRAKLELLRVPEPEAPDPPAGLSGQWLRAWAAYWRSDVARVASEVDLPLIRRLFEMYAQHEEAMDVVKKAIIVKGSTGQIRTNPLAEYAFKLAGQILRLEEELGLTPLSRQRLGIAVAERYRSLDELNRALDGHVGTTYEGPDPRLASV